MNYFKFIFIFGCFVGYLNAAINPKNEKLLILGVGKNIASCLPNMMQKIEQLGDYFKDYQVIIYENNSTDNTLDVLNAWMIKNPRVTIISEYLSDQQLSNRTKSHALRDKAPCRMELIAYARNQVLKQAMSDLFADYNYIIMTDLDFRIGWQVNDVIASFNCTEQWDCIAANGVNGDHYHYDRFAYRDDQFPLGPELLGEEFWRIRLEQPIAFAPSLPLQKVYSAFGGIALYKRNALKDCWYCGYVTKDLEHLSDQILNKNMATNHLYYRIYTLLINSDQRPLPLVFIPNSGYDLPVVCEHTTLHASMICKGYDKIYVNPALICLY
ncbi:MAG: hypothetical protein ACOYT8_00165 [Candidatus Dependentiae bacterium]